MNTNQIAHVASLVGEPARTAMLLALMDGRALTANELATAAHVSAPTASRHLGLLVEAGLLAVAQQGRHRYHRLASGEVAKVLEGIMQLAALKPAARPPRVVTGPRDAALRFARTCYDHLAGRLGVAMAEHLLGEGAIAFDGEAGRVTPRATEILARLGVDAAQAQATHSNTTRRLQCRPCLDWSERRFHLAGRLGALVCTHCLEQGWLLRRPGARALDLSPQGAAALRNWMGTQRWGSLTQPGSGP